jgi:hypothetical protein
MLVPGIATMALGATSFVIAAHHERKARQELFVRRPDYEELAYKHWWPVMNRVRIKELYEVEFPEGTRLKYSLRWRIAGIVFWLSGFVLLTRWV